jgi:hypothetical protein
VNCNQLEYLQQNFAALLAASDQQAELERLGVALVEDKEAVTAFRMKLEEQLNKAGTMLAAHVREHGCAN